MCMDSQVALLEFVSYWFKTLLLEVSCLILKRNVLFLLNFSNNWWVKESSSKLMSSKELVKSITTMPLIAFRDGKAHIPRSPLLAKAQKRQQQRNVAFSIYEKRNACVL